MASYPTKLSMATAAVAAACAYEASKPVGLGMLAFQPGPMSKASQDDITEMIVKRKHVYLDYLEGRMMKLNFAVLADRFEFDDRPLSPDYESWCVKYPTYTALFDAAAAVINQIEAAVGSAPSISEACDTDIVRTDHGGQDG